MGEWKKVRIGKIFHLEKGCLQSSKCIQGKYDFITAAKDWKTHNTYTHDCEAIVYAVAASGSLGQAHYINGKFIASDLCLILTEKDKTKYPINFLFYQIIFESLRDEVVSKTKTGTSKEAISQKNFSAYEIPYFSIDFQNANYQRLINAKKIIAEINKEIEAQKLYVKQLRRNILQDAIEGKLTADWRKEHPVQKGNPDYDAEALFELIQKERKVDKKQKTLPRILDAEKPFELPSGWKWVRLGEICNSITDGDHLPPPKQPSGIPFVVISDISSRKIHFKNGRFVSEDYFNKLSSEKIPKTGDILYTVTGSYGIPVPVNDFQFCVQRHIGIIKPVHLIKDFLFFSLVSPICKKQADSVAWGVAVKTIPIKELRNFIIPLPPVAEQKEIVRLIENMLLKVEHLEQQIVHREEYTNQLMKCILKDIFKEKNR